MARIKKAQTGRTVSYKTPSGTKVSMDTTGYSGGAKRFPTMMEKSVGRGGNSKTAYGYAKRKSATRAIEKSQGKSTGSVKMTTSGKAKAAFKSRSGSTIKKAQFGIGIGKEERQARRSQRQADRETRKMNRLPLTPFRRACSRTGRCGGKGLGYVGYKKGGSIKKTIKK